MMLFGSNLFFSRTVAIEISKSVNTEVVCKKYSNEISPEREEYSTDKYRFQTFNGNFETKIHSSTDVIPVFNIPNVICYGNTPPILPNTSLNNISGNWSPSIVSNINSGTYTFTPNNSNDTPITITINIIQECDITLSWSSGVSCQLATEPDPDIKDNDANIVDGPCIRVCENSTITYSLEGGGIGQLTLRNG